MRAAFFFSLLLISSIALPQTYPGKVIDQLSTNTPLSNGDVFTSAWIEVEKYNSIVVAIAASHNCSYSVQFSVNASDVDSTLNRSYKTDRITPPERLTIGRQYVRVEVTNNSGEDMTHMRLQTLVGDKHQLSFPLMSVASCVSYPRQSC